MDSTSSQSSSPTDSNVLPRYRHAAPSGPWPWMDFSNVDISTATNHAPELALRSTEAQDQVERSQMFMKCLKNQSTIYWMDVSHDNGKFSPSNITGSCISTVAAADHDEFWEKLQGERPGNIRVRSLFVDDLTPPVLRMLGTKYNIEPFFFTSSINWIPSRYQEALTHRQRDHITIILPFVRTVLKGSESQSPASSTPLDSAALQSSCSFSVDDHTNPQSSLIFRNGDILLMDLLAIHMIREEKANTIVSYHPESTGCRTSAKRLRSLMLLVGESVYWQNIFSKSKDPTFLLLAMLWYALYGWDESLESLHNHVTSLVSGVMTSPGEHTCDLHALQAQSEGTYEEVRKASNELMKKECGNLLGEIERLEKRRRALRNRLKNMLDIVDSRQTKRLIEATEQLTDPTARDSAAMRQILKQLTDATATNFTVMRQILYVMMIFPLAIFVAFVFMVNDKNITSYGSLETFSHYVKVTVAPMLMTACAGIIIMYTSFHKGDAECGVNRRKNQALWMGKIGAKVG
ncbi:hypothetical protein M405DRAFT_886069 [Rhizopogon salebrosus TDB-379]|nr:hypothetical protein M405DRAFT_886069 [Rhizopogon salebrosus TDB-379]